MECKRCKLQYIIKAGYKQFVEGSNKELKSVLSKLGC